MESHYLFYCPAPEEASCHLDEFETRHATAVLRLKPDDPIAITDGRGIIMQCRIDTLDKRGCHARIESRTEIAPPRPAITLAVGLPDREDFERILEIAAPLGVDRILPVVCGYCQQAWWKGSWEKYAARFQSKLVAGLKQSLSSRLPRLEPPCPFTSLMDCCTGPLVYGDGEGLPATPALANLGSAQEICALVGPPGGFTPDELDRLHQPHNLGLRLAPLRLTTGLAATVLVAVLAQHRLNQPSTR